MTSRSRNIQAELQIVCPLPDSCTHLCRGTGPTSELVHRASSESLACTALVLTGPCPLRAEVVPARRPGWKAPRKSRSSIAHMRSVNPLHAVSDDRLAIAQPRFMDGRCGGSLLLQPRVISRRRRHGRRRGTCRRHKGPAAESHKRKPWIKSFHVISSRHGRGTGEQRRLMQIWSAIIAVSRQRAICDFQFTGWRGYASWHDEPPADPPDWQRRRRVHPVRSTG